MILFSGNFNLPAHPEMTKFEKKSLKGAHPAKAAVILRRIIRSTTYP